MFVVFVHHGQVVEDIFLILMHTAHPVLRDDGHFILEGGVVGDAVRNHVGQQQTVTIFVLETLAVQRCPTGSTANQETTGALVTGSPAQIHRAL